MIRASIASQREYWAWRSHGSCWRTDVVASNQCDDRFRSEATTASMTDKEQKRRGHIAAFGPFAAVRGRSEERAVCARMQPKGGTRQTHCEGRCDRTGIRATESRRCAFGRGDEDDADTRATQPNSSTEIPTEHRVSVCVALRLADPNRAVLRAKPFRVAGPRCARLEIARWRGGGAANRT